MPITDCEKVLPSFVVDVGGDDEVILVHLA